MTSDAPELKMGSRVAGSLALGLPIALALCILVRPYLGLPNPSPPGAPGHAAEAAWAAASVGRNDPAAPLAEVDPTRIYCARKAYDALQRYRHSLPAYLRAARTHSESQDARGRLSELEDDYLCVYQQITPMGRRWANLPTPTS